LRHAEWTSDYREALAMSYLNADEPAQAALVIEEQKDLINESTSPRPIRQLRELQRTLSERYPHLSAGSAP
ncbi:MAG TPA: hypothetical protein VLH10_22200, partial [Yinghuangia sp.]|nr:hypothetical protein [Yinghuangia sp.]